MHSSRCQSPHQAAHSGPTGPHHEVAGPESHRRDSGRRPSRSCGIASLDNPMRTGRSPPDVDGEAFQVSLSVSSSKPPTHLFLRSKSLIGRRSSDQRRKHPLYLHGHPLWHDENFERSSPVSLLIFFPCTRKHTYTSRGRYPRSNFASRGRQLERDVDTRAALFPAGEREEARGAFGAREVGSGRLAVARTRPTGSRRASGEKVDPVDRGHARGFAGILSTSAYEAMPRRLNARGLGRDVV
ncbi:hypothetical protein ALC60_03430 [Trachymyrmex zeteki]|uniref:Uncharacterized protein n=1 Tax=Mycetomoellerius zeteki TaxID=64791 RepID=A0A151XAV1_9HYME|nr:hypothetical protein ALC60_03430 [Trachymyrmex zeteki]